MARIEGLIDALPGLHSFPWGRKYERCSKHGYK